MNEKSPLDWALLAVAAATIKTSEVTVVANPNDDSLPALSIGDTVIYQVREHVWGSDTNRLLWCVGLYWYASLAEALSNAVPVEVSRRVEKELGTKGLAT